MEEVADTVPICPSCQHILLSSPASRRTMCNFCGYVLGREEGRAAEVRLPRVPDAEGPGTNRGIGGGIVRLIRSLRRKSAASSAHGEGAASDDEDYIPGGSGTDVGSSAGLRKSCSVQNLPPISSSGSSRPPTLPSRGAPRLPRTLRPPSQPDPALEAPNKYIFNTDTLGKAMREAEEGGGWDEVATFFVSAFNSFADLNLVFHTGPMAESGGRPLSSLSQPEVDLDFVTATFEALTCLPSDVQKAVLKAVINCLLSDQRNADVALMKSVCRDDLRAYLILLQSPQFRKASTYVVYAHLLRQVATLCDRDHQTLADWLSLLGPAQMKATVRAVVDFIAMRLFPARPHDLPPMGKCSWWIPCAVKNLAILNAANDQGPHISFRDFYCEALDHWDLMGDFVQWQTPTLNAAFSFCQYPFVLSISAKKTILEGHAEQQMIATARDSIIGTLAVRRTPDMDMLFLILTIRRSHLLEDSLNEISKKQAQLRKKLRINFQGEMGLDMGGLKKEWFQLLIRQIFNPNYGMFVYYPDSGVYWFSTLENVVDERLLKEYHLVGVLMGLAVYNSVILDIRFPLCVYKKLLSPPVTPRILDIHDTPLGLAALSLSDLAAIQPTTAKGLQDLLDYDGDVEEDFGLNFQLSLEEFGVVRTVDLKADGGSVPVTKANRDEYVQLYANWLLNMGMERQFKAFYLGFHSVCSTNLLLLLRAEEIELLVCGCPHLDMDALRRVTVYDGFASHDKTVRYFWELVLKLPPRHQKRLLLFSTGSDRIPPAGMRDMSFKLSKMISSNPAISPQQMLPMAHTCFNQLILPDYQSRSTLRHKLAIALAHGEGFGLE